MAGHFGAPWNYATGATPWNHSIGQAPSAAELKRMGEQRAKEAAAEAARRAQQAAETKYVYTPTRYAGLPKIAYPPAPPPLVQLASAAADLAVASATKVRSAKTVETAQQAAGETAVAAASAIRKAAGVSEDAKAIAAVSRAKRAMADAATALATWTKQDPKKLGDGLIKQADALLTQDTEQKVNATQTVVADSVAELPAGAIRLDWQFWAGLAAAGVGVVLLARRGD